MYRSPERSDKGLPASDNRVMRKKFHRMEFYTIGPLLKKCYVDHTGQTRALGVIPCQHSRGTSIRRSVGQLQLALTAAV